MARVKTIIVGDVHGMLDELKELIEKVGYDKDNDRLILAGDLVDRGPKSAGVCDYAEEIGAEICIGNHDDKYIRYRRHEQKKTHVGRKHYRNPMTLNEHKQEVWKSLSDQNLDYLEAGKYCVPVWEYNALVVHAGVLPASVVGDLPYDKRDREEYIFTRYIDKDSFRQKSLGPNFTKPVNSIHWTEAYDGFVDIVYGHDVRSFDEPVVEYNEKGARMIGLDTGSCFGGKLSCIIFTPENPQGVFESIKAKKCWKTYRIVKDEKKNGK